MQIIDLDVKHILLFVTCEYSICILDWKICHRLVCYGKLQAFVIYLQIINQTSLFYFVYKLPTIF